jgi:Carboxypeptidase regulatory-like domain
MKNGNWLVVFIVLLGLSFSAAAQDKKSGGAKGKVRNQRGNAIAGVSVEARQNGQTIAEVKTDKDGNFLINNLSAGTYDFLFTKEGYSDGSMSKVEIKAGNARSLGDNLALTVDEGTLAIIRGVVFDQDGRSLPGAKIEIAKVSGGEKGKTLATSYSSVSGDFVFKFSPSAAKYRISVTWRDAEPASKEVTVEGAQVYRLAISLKVTKQ